MAQLVLLWRSGARLSFNLPDTSLRQLRRDAMAELNSTRLSLMPEGLEATLTHQDLAVLIHFLRRNPEQMAAS